MKLLPWYHLPKWSKQNTSGGLEQTLYLLERLQIHLDVSLVMDLQADCYVFVICSDYGGVTRDSSALLHKSRCIG